ncbi:hypothetical protein ACFORG_17080 [Lutimaribacter marinistellae]|uniref:Uncharacterized protein n=1 Tax=Lutimaribacter marinistellae TaxID=1820329 RepID=A0ABV7TIL9_9RHOB
MAVLAAMGPLMAPVAAVAQAPDAVLRRETLGAMVSRILPGDGVTPSGEVVAIVSEIDTILVKSTDWSEITNNVTRWLNDGGPEFATRPIEQQDAVLAWMQDAGTQTPQGYYLALVRRLAIELHYSQPEARMGMALASAPQPDGYQPPWTR